MLREVISRGWCGTFHRFATARAYPMSLSVSSCAPIVKASTDPGRTRSSAATTRLESVPPLR
jgi:hypothetical protein